MRDPERPDRPDRPDRPVEAAPEGVRSTPGPPGPTPAGPVPVREVMKTPGSGSAIGGSGAPGETGEPGAVAEDVTREFDREDGPWLARKAGSGAYGTGRLGTARLVAVHFCRGEDPGTPVREALIPAGAFADLAAEELRDLFDRATPVELDR